jgi:hypothetical protein
MPGQAAQEQGHAAILSGSRPSAGPRIPQSRASSSTVIGVGVVGALLTAAAIAGVVMMGSASTPVITRVAAVSAPAAVAQTSAIAPAMVPAPVGPVLAATYVAPALSPVAAPTPAPDLAQSFARLAGPAPAPPLNVPGQCEIGQVQQLAINVFASRRKEIGNVLRIYSGSYVSPPIVLTTSSQTVTFPAPPGSRGWARIIVEQKRADGSTYDEEANGITVEHEGSIDLHHDVDLLRWTTPRC